MARGFLSGAIWGTVLSVGSLGAVSVLNPASDQIGQSIPEHMSVADPVQGDTSVEPDVSMPDVETAATEPENTPAQDTSEPEIAEAETASEIMMDDNAESAVPAAPEADSPIEMDAGDAEVTIEPTDATPEPTMEAGDEPGRKPADVTAVAPENDAPELATPDEDAETTPDNTAAAPIPAPETGEEVAALTVPATPETVQPQVYAPDDVTPEAPAAPTLDVPESETGLNVSTEPAQPPVPPAPSAETALVPDPIAEATPSDPVSDASTTAENMAEDTTVAEEDADEADRPQVRRLVPDAPEADTEAETDTTAALRPSIGRPAASLTDRAPGNSARIPSIGAGASNDESPETDDAMTLDQSVPPLQRFAASIDSDPALPQMSIVMIDDGTGPLGPDTLEGFPFPVTFALDPGQPGATERMAAYRTLGYEVAALVDLPDAAQPTDVEQILGGALAMLPETVALIEAPGSGLQAARAVIEQAASFAADSGHGLVFLPNGLNTAQAIAQREDVPTVSILRDFDGDGQDARTKRRFLDGAAFRARQDGSVVMLGRLTPDTLSALVLWSLQDRASSVSMVPVSSILLSQSN